MRAHWYVSPFPSSHGAVAQTVAVLSKHLEVAPTADCTNHTSVTSRANDFCFADTPA